MKHTPGPWDFDLDPNGAFWVTVAPVRDMQDPTTIARRGEWGHRCEESHANARLIASAPDMLAALISLLEDVGRANSMPGAVQARAAIAKATGEQP